MKKSRYSVSQIPCAPIWLWVVTSAAQRVEPPASTALVRWMAAGYGSHALTAGSASRAGRTSSAPDSAVIS